MTTQIQISNPGAQAPDRSRRRVADRPAACPAPFEWACPEPVEWACPEARRLHSSASRNPPCRPRPAPVLNAAHRAAQNHPKIDAPRPQEFFGKNSYAHTTPRPAASFPTPD